MFKDSPPKSVCVVRLSAIGDTCHALAVVRSIQDNWPETRISWIIGKTEASLLGDIPEIEFIIFDKSAGFSAYRKLRRKLKGRRFDVALCMHASLRANLIIPLIPSRHKIGFDRARARDYQWWFTNRRIAARPRPHALDSMAQFAEFIGVRRRQLRWDIPLSATHREFAARFIDPEKPALLISPCSSDRARNFRNWSAENYAAAANYARDKYGCQIVLTGGASAEELEYGQTISTLCGNQAVNLIGRTTLKQLLALIRAATAVLCPDSGPAHMATAAGTPVIALFATSNPQRTGPYLSQQLVVNAYPEAVERFLGKDVAQIRFGRRVRHPGATGLIRLWEVKNKLDRAFSEI